jgi:hypothetical protein
MKSLSVLCFLMVSAVLCAQENAPAVEGYISSVPSGAELRVNGEPVLTTPSTVYQKHIQLNGRDAMITDPGLGGELGLGDNVQVFGHKDRHTHSIVATEIVLQRDSKRISGFAVVQRVVATSPQLIVEADGYHIAITKKTALRNKPPLTAQTVVAPNLWIAYRGKWNSHGLVVADRASFSQFTLTKRMKEGMRRSQGKLVAPNYGTAAAESGQNGEIIAPYMAGRKNTGSIPDDLALQQRVRRIGERLIPACQKSLAKTDPQKIDFRFYATNDKIPQLIGSPHGLIVIPEQLVKKLQNDDQVAAVLAAAVAEALEWQVPPAVVNGSGPAMVEIGEMPFVGPVAGVILISAGLYEIKHDSYPSRLDPLQSERVSLSLMHDAGYDVRQAPVAWQILSSRNGKDGVNKAPSPQSAYLLSIIGMEYSQGAGLAEATPQAAGN